MTKARDFHSPSRALPDSKSISHGNEGQGVQATDVVSGYFFQFLSEAFFFISLLPRHSKTQNIRFSFTFIDLFW